MPGEDLKSLLDVIGGPGGSAGVLVAFGWFAWKLLSRFDAMLKARDEALATTVDVIRSSHKEFADRVVGVLDRNSQALSETATSNRENSQAISKLSYDMDRLREAIDRNERDERKE